MRSVTKEILTRTEVSFGDALCLLYHFFEAGDYEERTSHVPILHTHLFYEIMMPAEYSYRVVLQEGRDGISLSESVCLPIAPQTPHCAVGTARKPPVSFGILLEKTEGSVGFYQAISERLQQISGKTIPLSEKSRSLFLSWRQCDAKTLDGYCQSKILAYQFLYSFFKDINSLEEGRLNASVQKRADLTTLLDTLLDDRRYTLKEIADALGYTRRQTLRLVYQRYGLSYRTVRENKLLEAAKAYLVAEGEMSVKEIAGALGYESESSFFSFFKRKTGYTPKQYRNMCRQCKEKKK